MHGGSVGRTAARRAAQVARIASEDGPAELMARVRRAAARAIDAPTASSPVRARQVLRALPGAYPPGHVPPSTTPSGPLVVNWVMTPPPPGSGGHTTLLRLVEHLEASGHTCRLYLYDRYGGDVRGHEEVVRAHWPQIRAEVHDAEGRPAGGHDAAGHLAAGHVAAGHRAGPLMAPCDAVIATSWQTAYTVADPLTPGRRFYLVQDFEPAFHPAGSDSILAENTYRLGFHGITAGRWLAGTLLADYGMPCDHFEFGADTGTYTDLGRDDRDGVVFYAKPSTPRRAYALGLMALEDFARRHPDVPIHFFGEDVGALPFPVTRHGVITPDALNVLYNRCLAGLCLSATNMSLIPFELLASGCVPVVNDAPHNRLVLDNPHVRYVPPTAHDLSDALSDVVTGLATPQARRERAAAAAHSVADLPWDTAGDAVERSLLRLLRPPVSPSTPASPGTTAPQATTAMASAASAARPDQPSPESREPA